MKSLKGIFISVVGAVALVFAAAPVRADAVSDVMSLFNASGLMLNTAVATEDGEIAKQVAFGALGGPLFAFDSFSNAASTGHYILIAEQMPDGNQIITDAIGVTPGVTGLVTGPAFAYLSDAGEQGLTQDQLLAAGFIFKDGPTLVEDPTAGIFLDSRTNPLLANYIDFTKTGAGAYLTFSSDGAPDGGSAVALLGIALAGIEGLRRMIGARKA